MSTFNINTTMLNRVIKDARYGFMSEDLLKAKHIINALSQVYAYARAIEHTEDAQHVYKTVHQGRLSDALPPPYIENVYKNKDMEQIIKAYHMANPDYDYHRAYACYHAHTTTNALIVEPRPSTTDQSLPEAIIKTVVKLETIQARLVKNMSDFPYMNEWEEYFVIKFTRVT
jgi:hypothetical protein